MRLFVFNFLLLASVVIASSEERQKRHFPILMKWIKSALLGPEDPIIEEVAVSPSRPEYEVFRLPGHDDVLVKVSPKILNAEGVVYREIEPVNINAFGSVIGIESPDDTIAAVREVDNLLSSRILYGGYDDVMKDHIVAMFPGIRTKEEEIVPVIESRHVLSEAIRPLEERVDFEVPVDLDSNEQINSNEQATIITADTKPGTELVETIKKNELPNCIRRRIDAAVLLGADPYRYERVEEVYPTPAVEISYPKLGDPLIQNQFHEKNLKGFESVTDFGLPATLSQNSVDSLKPIHLEEVQVSFSKDKSKSENEKLTAFTNTGKKVDLSQTLGPIPSWYLERMNITDNLKANDQLKRIVIAATKENVASQRVANSGLLANSLKLLKSEVIDTHPLHFHSLYPVHLENVQDSFPKDNGNSGSENLSPYTSAGKKVNLSTPYPYLKHIEVPDNLKTNDQLKPVVIAPTKEHSLSKYIENVAVARENSKIQIKKESDKEEADQKAKPKENVPLAHIKMAEVPAKSKTVAKKEDDRVKPVQILTTSTPKANISNVKGHGYVYVNRPNPITTNLVKESDLLRTNVKTNNNNNLKVVAPVKMVPTKASSAQLKDIEQNKKVTQPKRGPVASNANGLKTNELKEKPSLPQNPVPILNNTKSKENTHKKHFKIVEPHVRTYSYQQKQADGSSINVEADKDVISVDFKGRGDIPEK